MHRDRTVAGGDADCLRMRTVWGRTSRCESVQKSIRKHEGDEKNEGGRGEEERPYPTAQAVARFVPRKVAFPGRVAQLITPNGCPPLS
jgi:hypothetical protein